MPEYIEPHIATLNPESLNIPPPMTSSESPELSAFEIADILAAEAEFAAGQTETYDNPQDLLAALHASRERHKSTRGGQ
jgi:hypothetical protein